MADDWTSDSPGWTPVNVRSLAQIREDLERREREQRTAQAARGSAAAAWLRSLPDEARNDPLMEMAAQCAMMGVPLHPQMYQRIADRAAELGVEMP